MTKGSKGVRESEDTDVAATMPTPEPAEHTWASKEDDTDPCFLQSWKNIQSCMAFLFSQIQLYNGEFGPHSLCVLRASRLSVLSVTLFMLDLLFGSHD